MNGGPTLLLDANLLVLFVVGSLDRNLINTHKRTRKYIDDDYELLCQFLTGFRRILVTPNILTEASNLVVQGINEPRRQQLLMKLKRIVGEVTEVYVESARACEQQHFRRLGLTDSTIHQTSSTVNLVLTDDLDLYLSLADTGKAVNFNHLRPSAWKTK